MYLPHGEMVDAFLSVYAHSKFYVVSHCCHLTTLDVWQAADAFCSAYLSRTLTRLSDAVSTLFATGSRSPGHVASAGDIIKLTNLMKEELDSAMPDPRVTALVANVVAQALKLLGEKCEYQMASGPDARQVSAGTT